MRSRFQKWFTVLIAAGLISSLGVTAAAASPDGSAAGTRAPTEHAPLSPHDQAKMQVLKQKWQALRTAHAEARDEARQLHTDLEELHTLAQQVRESGQAHKLRSLQADQKALEENLRRVHDLRAELKDLHKELKGYKNSSDLDAAIKTVDQMKPLMQQYQTALRQADERVQRLIAKLK